MADYHEIAQGAILYVKDEKSVQKLTFSGRFGIIRVSKRTIRLSLLNRNLYDKYN